MNGTISANETRMPTVLAVSPMIGGAVNCAIVCMQRERGDVFRRRPVARPRRGGKRHRQRRGDAEADQREAHERQNTLAPETTSKQPAERDDRQRHGDADRAEPLDPAVGEQAPENLGREEGRQRQRRDPVQRMEHVAEVDHRPRPRAGLKPDAAKREAGEEKRRDGRKGKPRRPRAGVRPRRRRWHQRHDDDGRRDGHHGHHGEQMHEAARCPHAVAAVPMSDAERTPRLHMPWQRFMMRRPTAYSTRSASTFMAMLVRLKLSPIPAAAKKKATADGARAASAVARPSKGQPEQKGRARADALDHAARERYRDQDADIHPEQGHAQRRLAGVHVFLDFGKPGKEPAGAQRMDEEHGHDRVFRFSRPTQHVSALLPTAI